MKFTLIILILHNVLFCVSFDSEKKLYTKLVQLSEEKE